MFSIVTVPHWISPEINESCCFFYIFISTWYCVLFQPILYRYVVKSFIIENFNLWIAYNIEHLFIYLFAICISFGMMSFQIFYPFFHQVLCFLIVEFSLFFVYFRFQSFNRCMFYKYFLPGYGLFFLFFYQYIFQSKSFFNLNEVELIKFFFHGSCFLSSPTQGHLDFLLGVL